MACPTPHILEVEELLPTSAGRPPASGGLHLRRAGLAAAVVVAALLLGAAVLAALVGHSSGVAATSPEDPEQKFLPLGVTVGGISDTTEPVPDNTEPALDTTQPDLTTTQSALDTTEPILPVQGTALPVPGIALPIPSIRLPILGIRAEFGLGDTREGPPPPDYDGPVVEVPAPEDGPPQGEYDEHRARAFALLAKLTYCGAMPGASLCMNTCGEASNQVCQDAAVSVVGTSRFVTTGDQGVDRAEGAYVGNIRVNGETGCFVAFRGTVDNWSNRDRDVETALMSLPPTLPCQGCRVHSGWWTTALAIEPLVRAELAKIGCASGADAKVWLTGHGSGAARAALAAYLLGTEYKIQSSYLFHTPLFGNEEFVRRFRWMFGPTRPIWFITEGPDAVSRWPSVSELGYALPSYEVHYPEYGEREVCSAPADKSCGVLKYATTELRRDLNCRSRLAPDGDFCRFEDVEATCIRGTLTVPRSSAQADRPRFLAVPLDARTQPRHFYDENMAQCFAMISRALFCGDSVGLVSVMEDAVARACPAAGMRIESGSIRPVWINDGAVRGAIFGAVFRVRRMEGIGSTVPPEACVVGIRGAYIDVKKHNDDVGSRWQLEDFPGCYGCKVHRGYRAMFANLLSAPLSTALGQLGCQRVYVTGYSFGAALAPFAMWALQEMGYDVQLSYLYGGPRVGNVHFTRGLAQRLGRNVSSFSITFNRDQVPRFPAKWKGYEQLGYQVWYSNTSRKYTVCEREEGCGLNRFKREELDFPSHCGLPLVTDGRMCPTGRNDTDNFYVRCEGYGKPLPLPRPPTPKYWRQSP